MGVLSSRPLIEWQHFYFKESIKLKFLEDLGLPWQKKVVKRLGGQINKLEFQLCKRGDLSDAKAFDAFFFNFFHHTFYHGYFRFLR
jgi:hypothetical protein